MNKDEIIRMAREAGFQIAENATDESIEKFERFAALVAYEVGIAQYNNGYEAGQRNEREVCAKVASSMVLPDASNYPFHIAAAIRARGSNGS